MYVVTQNSKGVAVVYEATEDEARLFNEAPEQFPDDLSGWVIGDALDLESEMSKTQMVAIYNSLAGESLVKFQNKSTGASRTMPLIERNAKPFDELLKGKVIIPGVKDPVPEAGPAPEESQFKTTGETGKPKRRGRTDRGIHNIKPLDRLVACRAGTKQQALIDALAKGATMAELLDATSAKNGGRDWSEGSVKSGFYEDVNSKKGYGVRTEVVEEGKPETYRYHLVLPEGVDAPLAPTAKKKVDS